MSRHIFILTCLAQIGTIYALVCNTNASQGPINQNENLAQQAGDVISQRTNVNGEVVFIVPEPALQEQSAQCDGVPQSVTKKQSSNTQFIVLPVAVIEDQTVPKAQKESGDSGMTTPTFVSTIQLVHVDSGRVIGTPRCSSSTNNCDESRPILLPIDFSVSCPRNLKQYNTIWDLDSHSIPSANFKDLQKTKSGSEPATLVVPNYGSNDGDSTLYKQTKSGFNTFNLDTMFDQPVTSERMTAEDIADRFDSSNIEKKATKMMNTMQTQENCDFDSSHEFALNSRSKKSTMSTNNDISNGTDSVSSSTDSSSTDSTSSTDSSSENADVDEDNIDEDFKKNMYDMSGLLYLNETSGEMQYPQSGPTSDTSYVWRKIHERQMRKVRERAGENMLEGQSKKKAENMAYYGVLMGLDNVLYPRDEAKQKLVRERVLGPTWVRGQVTKRTQMREEQQQFKSTLSTKIKKMHVQMMEEQGAKLSKTTNQAQVLPNSLRESSLGVEREPVGANNEDWQLDDMRAQGARQLGVEDWTQEQRKENAISTASRVISNMDSRDKLLFVKSSQQDYLERNLRETDVQERQKGRHRQMKTMALDSISKQPFLGDLSKTVGNVGLDNLMADMTGKGLGGVFNGGSVDLGGLAGNAALWASESMMNVNDKTAPDNEENVSNIQEKFLQRYMTDLTSTKMKEDNIGSVGYSSKVANNTAMVSLRIRPLGSGPLELVMPCKGYVTSGDSGNEWVVADSTQPFKLERPVSVMSTHLRDQPASQMMNLGNKKVAARSLHRPQITFKGKLSQQNVQSHDPIDVREKNVEEQTESPTARVTEKMQQRFRTLHARADKVRNELMKKQQSQRTLSTGRRRSMKTMQTDTSQPCMMRVVPVTSVDGTVEDSIVECVPVSSSCPTSVSFDNQGLLAMTRVPLHEVPTSSLFLSESMTTLSYDMDYASVNTYPFIIGQMALRNFSPFEQFLTAKSAKRQFSSFTFQWGIQIQPIIDIAIGNIPNIVFNPLEGILNSILQAVITLLETIIPGIGQLIPDINIPNIGLSLSTNDFPFGFRGTHLHTEDSEVVVSYSITAPPQTHVLGRSIAHMGRSSVPFTMDVSRSVHVPAGVYGQTTGQVITYDYRVPGIYEGANLVNTEFIVDVI